MKTKQFQCNRYSFVTVTVWKHTDRHRKAMFEYVFARKFEFGFVAISKGGFTCGTPNIATCRIGDMKCRHHSVCWLHEMKQSGMLVPQLVARRITVLLFTDNTLGKRQRSDEFKSPKHKQRSHSTRLLRLCDLELWTIKHWLLVCCGTKPIVSGLLVVCWITVDSTRTLSLAPNVKERLWGCLYSSISIPRNCG